MFTIPASFFFPPFYNQHSFEESKEKVCFLLKLLFIMEKHFIRFLFGYLQQQ